MTDKGKNAGRRDVLCKTFIRAVRRYMWTLFEKEVDVSQFKNNKTSEFYRQSVIKFYEKHFQKYSDLEIAPYKDVGNIYFILALFLNTKYSFPYKSDKQRRFIIFFESICQKFSTCKYERFLMSNNISEIFALFLRSGFVDKVINAYPKLTKAKEMYLDTAKSMAEFKYKISMINMK